MGNCSERIKVQSGAAFLLEELFSGFSRINMSPRRDMGSLRCAGLTALLLCTGRSPERRPLHVNECFCSHEMRHCKRTHLGVISLGAQLFNDMQMISYSAKRTYIINETYN